MRDLSLGDCCRQKTLPSFICYLTELRVMNLKSCSKLTALPTSFGNLIALQELDLEGGLNLHASFALLKGLRVPNRRQNAQ
jgi:hypothetical protein